MSDELPPLSEPLLRILSERTGLVSLVGDYASEAVRAAVERERATFVSTGSYPDNNVRYAGAQAKAEKGLEPVAYMALCDGVAIQTALASNRDFRAAWADRMWDVVPLYAHPPTQAEPATQANASGGYVPPNPPTSEYANISEHVDEDWAERDKRIHNDAIEAAAKEIEYHCADEPVLASHVRRLKREPR